jgi:chromosome partitioning protein
MQRVISVINQKGGVGKTTTAVNLAAFLAKQGKRVLVIDMDPQGNATSGLGIDKLNLNTNTYNLFIENKKVDQLAVTTLIENLHLVPTNSDLASVEIQLAGELSRESKFRNYISKQTHTYDFVLIDCPPSLGLLTINALVGSSDVLIPVQSEYYAMEGLSQLIQIIERVQKGLNPTLRILGVIVTMFDSRTSLSGQVYDEMTKAFGGLVFKTVIPRNVRLAEAPSHGKPIVLYDKWSKGARSYKALAKEVISRVK